jgi:hypothetical protein
MTSKYSAIGAPRLGQPQDWQHRMPKGFVSERDLNPHAMTCGFV